MNYKLSRREFMKVSAGTSLTIALNLQAFNVESSTKKTVDSTFSPSIWLNISKDNKITITIAESEMGQGVFTTLSMMVAEELDADWNQISAVHADADMKYGEQLTGGSSSLRNNWNRLRMAGAAARAILVKAAANKWNIKADQCLTNESTVINSLNNEQFSYGELIEFTADIPLPESVMLKSKDQYKFIGKPIPRLDSPIKTNGEAKFGNDIMLDGALTATVIHPPIMGSEILSYDSTKSMQVKGVINIIQIEEGIAVVAKDFWSAKKGAQLLDVKWGNDKNKNINSEYIKKILIENLQDTGNHKIEMDSGNAMSLISASKNTVHSEYFLPYQAHAAMETMTCTAYVNNANCEVWVPTQAPTRAKDQARYRSQSLFSRLSYKFLKSGSGNVTLHNTMIGGSFGRRLQIDFVSEAVQISKSINKPIRLIWEREQDIKNDYYHPSTLHSLSAALDKEGMPLAWWHRASGQKQRFGGALIPYDIPNIKIQGKRFSLPIKIGPWRSVNHYYNAFVVESFIDELAAKTNHDPLEYRIKLLKDTQFINVLKQVASKANWGKTLAKGHFHGLAMHKGFGTYVAQIAEISINNDGSIKVHKVTAAIDAGTVVNPDIVKAQMEGAIVFGLSAALKGKITFDNGSPTQSNYHNFPILKYSEMPVIETIIIESDKSPEGIGEPGVPSIGPAIANAYFSATGKRTYTLPIETS
jgi:isoquinoline 1-oxidoreductase beta subunit